MTIPKTVIILFLTGLVICRGMAQDQSPPARQDTLKGSITPERAWWNVLHYDLTLELDEQKKTISGKNIIEYEIIREPHPPLMQIDLQSPLTIDSVTTGSKKLSFTQEGNVWWVINPQQAEKINTITVYYSGTPKESVKPPYDGGITWAKDSMGRDWISVSCQMVGGSIWYPCKDHYSEEPDRGASLTLIVSDPLVVVGNGRQVSRKQVSPGKQAYTWSVVSPINNYGLTFYAGYYIPIRRTFAGEKGPLDMTYWVLDYNREKALSHMIPEVNKTMTAFEKWFGPYPFYEDGFQMVEASYIGMEHQSAVAYGNQFKKGRFKFRNLTALDLETDRLIVHEMAHEWFGNNITMSDMADRWVQEGFAAYGEELFIEELLGREAGREFFVSRQRNFIKNQQPLISGYGIFKDAGPDMYFKGWAIVHMLREMVDDDGKFKDLLRALNKAFYHQTITSGQLEGFISDFLEKDYRKFFDQYLRIASLPVLEYYVEGQSLIFRLTAKTNGLFMPVKLSAGQDFWLQAGPAWRETAYPGGDFSVPIVANPDFLLELRKVK